MGYLAQFINELFNWLLLWGSLSHLPAIHIVLLLNSPCTPGHPLLLRNSPCTPGHPLLLRNSPCENIPVRSTAAQASSVLISERVSQAGCMPCPDSLS